MNRLKITTLLLLSFLSQSCSLSNNRYQIKNDHRPSKTPPLAHIENAVPRYEPYSRGGNKNYRLRGINYTVLKDITEFTESGYASWYGNKFHGHLTANGERYNMFAMSAAHKNLPLPCYVQVTNVENNKQVIVRINDRGPFHPGRIIDLSYAAAHKLDMLKSGTAKVTIKLLYFPKNEKTSNLISHYYIQYLVTSSPEKAAQLVNKVSEKYQEESLFIEDKDHYKLQIGPFRNQSAAQDLLKKIQKDYPKSFIVKHKE